MPKVSAAIARDKERRAVELHLAGANFDAIAEQVGYASRSGAYDAVMRAISRETAQAVDEVRATEIARIDAMLMAIWAKARRGDVLAIDRVLKLMERRAKYLGLETAVNVNITHRSITEARTEAEETLAKFRPKLSLVEDAG